MFLSPVKMYIYYCEYIWILCTLALKAVMDQHTNLYSTKLELYFFSLYYFFILQQVDRKYTFCYCSIFLTSVWFLHDPSNRILSDYTLSDNSVVVAVIFVYPLPLSCHTGD
jgi:hypothetical protein